MVSIIFWFDFTFNLRFDLCLFITQMKKIFFLDIIIIFQLIPFVFFGDYNNFEILFTLKLINIMFFYTWFIFAPYLQIKNIDF